MRRLALGLAVIWLFCAFGMRLYDMRRPHLHISALTGGQRHYLATMAWIEGMPAGPPRPGRLVVADVRLDGKLLRHAVAPLPPDWLDCRLWLEEGDDVVQALALCPGRGPLRLTAAGTSVPGLGPDTRPGTLYSLTPVAALDPEKIISQIHHMHRAEDAPFHPVLLLLGLVCTLPLWRTARDLWRKARRLRGPATLEGVMEHAEGGRMVLRTGDRRVEVFVEQGEMLSLGLGAAAVAAGDAMVADGLQAAIQGEVEHLSDGAFRGQEVLRLRRGALIVVGDALAEARRRLLWAAGQDAALATAGILIAGLVAAGFGL